MVVIKLLSSLFYAKQFCILLLLLIFNLKHAVLIILGVFSLSFQPEELQYLNINLRLDAFIIKDSFSLRWTSEAGMVENMASIVEEYKDTRQLLVSVIYRLERFIVRYKRYEI